MFLKIYGGGPAIKREKPYIYSNIVVDANTEVVQAPSSSFDKNLKSPRG